MTNLSEATTTLTPTALLAAYCHAGRQRDARVVLQWLVASDARDLALPAVLGSLVAAGDSPGRAAWRILALLAGVWVPQN